MPISSYKMFGLLSKKDVAEGEVTAITRMGQPLLPADKDNMNPPLYFNTQNSTLSDSLTHCIHGEETVSVTAQDIKEEGDRDCGDGISSRGISSTVIPLMEDGMVEAGVVGDPIIVHPRQHAACDNIRTNNIQEKDDGLLEEEGLWAEIQNSFCESAHWVDGTFVALSALFILLIIGVLIEILYVAITILGRRGAGFHLFDLHKHHADASSESINHLLASIL